MLATLLFVLLLISTEMYSDEWIRTSHVGELGIRAPEESYTLAFFLAKKQNICDSWLLASLLSIRSSCYGPHLLSRLPFQHAIFSLLFTAIKQDFIKGTLVAAKDQVFPQPDAEQGMNCTLVPALFCWSRTLLFKTLKQAYRKIKTDPIYMLKLPDTCVCLEEITHCLY